MIQPATSIENPVADSPKWSYRWQSVTRLTLGSRLVSEIYQWNCGWYASGFTRRTEGDIELTIAVPLGGPVSLSYATALAERFAKGFTEEKAPPDAL